MRASRSKRAQPLGIEREGGRQDLDRHIAPQLRIARAIHLAHPARAEQRDDSIDADLLADQVQSQIPNP